MTDIGSVGFLAAAAQPMQRRCDREQRRGLADSLGKADPDSENFLDRPLNLEIASDIGVGELADLAGQQETKQRRRAERDGHCRRRREIELVAVPKSQSARQVLVGEAAPKA